jgi:hypothetical protein
MIKAGHNSSTTRPGSLGVSRLTVEVAGGVSVSQSRESTCCWRAACTLPLPTKLPHKPQVACGVCRDAPCPSNSKAPGELRAAESRELHRAQSLVACALSQCCAHSLPLRPFRSCRRGVAGRGDPVPASSRVPKHTTAAAPGRSPVHPSKHVPLHCHWILLAKAAKASTRVAVSEALIGCCSLIRA